MLAFRLSYILYSDICHSYFVFWVFRHLQPLLEAPGTPVAALPGQPQARLLLCAVCSGRSISRASILFACFICLFRRKLEIRIEKEIVWKEATKSILENEIRNARAPLVEVHPCSERHLNESTVRSYFEAFKKIEMRISLKNKKEPTSFSDSWKFLCFTRLNSLHFPLCMFLIDILIFKDATPTFNRRWLYLNWILRENSLTLLFFSFIFSNRYLSSAFCVPGLSLSRALWRVCSSLGYPGYLKIKENPRQRCPLLH